MLHQIKRYGENGRFIPLELNYRVILGLTLKIKRYGLSGMPKGYTPPYRYPRV